MKSRRDVKSYLSSSLSVILLNLGILYGLSIIFIPIIRAIVGAGFKWSAPFTIAGQHQIDDKFSIGLIILRFVVLLIEAYLIAIVIIEPLRKLDFVGTFIFLDMVISLIFLTPPGWKMFLILIFEILFCWGISLLFGIFHRKMMDKVMVFKRKN